MPRLHKVQDLVIKQREDIVKLIQRKLKAIKIKVGHFLITFEESTFRYMNINVHFQGGFHSLGMICIQGSLNAAKAFKLVKEQLQLLGLDLNKDEIATVTDGASLMVKFRKDTCPNM